VTIHEITAAQRAFFRTGATLELSFRLDALDKLARAVRDREEALLAALKADLGKSETEGYLCEIGMVLSELSFVKKHLPRWGKDRRVSTPLALFPAKSFTVQEPYGVVLVMSPWNYPLSCLVIGTTVALLLALRAGIREAFAAADGSRPKDWIGRGILAHLLSLALAIWSDLVPLTEPSMFGMAIMDEWSWLYYGRSIAFIVLQIYLLRCVYRQSEALAGRGYDIVPAPVRLPGKQFTLSVFLLVLAALPPVLWLGGRLDNGPAEAVSINLSEEHAVIRERLMAMGMAEKLALALDEIELERCAAAVGVTACNPKDTHQSDDYDAPINGPSILYEIDGGLAELSSWIVYLPDGQYRRYQWFEYREMPDCRLQEQFSVDPIGNYHTYDYGGRILWERNGSTFAAAPAIRLAGGQTAEELDEMTDWLHQEELRRLGHYHYSPYYSFSIPRGAEGMRGYLAYTQDADPHEVYEFCYTFLRHQQRLLHYPFADINALGGAQHAGEYGPIRSVYGHFSYYGDTPY